MRDSSYQEVSGLAGRVRTYPDPVISPLDKYLPTLHLHLIQPSDQLLPVLLLLQVDQRPLGGVLVRPRLDVDDLDLSLSLHQGHDLLLSEGGRKVPDIDTSSLRGETVLLHMTNQTTLPAHLATLHPRFDCLEIADALGLCPPHLRSYLTISRAALLTGGGGGIHSTFFQQFFSTELLNNSGLK